MGTFSSRVRKNPDCLTTASLVRTEELVDPARTEPGRGRDLTDGQPRLMGLDDGPDPLALGLFQTFGGEAEPGCDLLFAANPLIQLVVGFHPSRLTISPVAVQQTGQLTACSWSNATRTPDLPSAPVASGPRAPLSSRSAGRLWSGTIRDAVVTACAPSS